MDITIKELEKLVPMYCGELESINASQYADYQFSEGYLKRKEKLIRQQQKIYYPLIKTTSRKIVAALAAAALMGTMTVAAYEPARNAVKDFFMSIFATHSDISPVNISDIDAPKTIGDIYEITYDLSEYSINYERYDDICRHIFYYNEMDNRTIMFWQYVKSEFGVSINTEGRETSLINIGDYEALYYTDINDYYTVIWDNGEYIIHISSNVGENELIAIAKSVQKVE